MKIKTNYDGCPYITAGKEYAIAGAVIFADDGQIVELDDVIGFDWQIVQEEYFSQEVAQEMYDALVAILDMKGNVYYCLDSAELDLSDIFELAGNVVNKMEKNDE